MYKGRLCVRLSEWYALRMGPGQRRAAARLVADRPFDLSVGVAAPLSVKPMQLIPLKAVLFREPACGDNNAVTMPESAQSASMRMKRLQRELRLCGMRGRAAPSRNMRAVDKSLGKACGGWGCYCERCAAGIPAQAQGEECQISHEPISTLVYCSRFLPPFPTMYCKCALPSSQ